MHIYDYVHLKIIKIQINEIRFKKIIKDNKIDTIDIKSKNTCYEWNFFESICKQYKFVKQEIQDYY